MLVITAFTLDEIERSISGSFRPEQADLRAIEDYAKQHDCRYIRLDQDGPIYDDLETYDW